MGDRVGTDKSSLTMFRNRSICAVFSDQRTRSFRLAPVLSLKFEARGGLGTHPAAAPFMTIKGKLDLIGREIEWPRPGQ